MARKLSDPSILAIRNRAIANEKCDGWPHNSLVASLKKAASDVHRLHAEVNRLQDANDHLKAHPPTR